MSLEELLPEHVKATGGTLEIVTGSRNVNGTVSRNIVKDR